MPCRVKIAASACPCSTSAGSWGGGRCRHLRRVVPPALPAGSSHNLASLSPAELAPGFSATYIGMALIATAALLVTLLALKRHELASKHA